MKRREKLSKLSRLELVELIYDIRRDNVALEKRCKKLEERLELARQRVNAEEESEASEMEDRFNTFGERLDSMEDMIRDIRRQLVGRRLSTHADDTAGGHL